MPSFSEDDYIDFCVTEALVYRGAKAKADAAKEREKKEWKKGAGSLLQAPSGKRRL